MTTNDDHVGQIFSENDHGRDGRYGRKWSFFATILLNEKNNFSA